MSEKKKVSSEENKKTNKTETSKKKTTKSEKKKTTKKSTKTAKKETKKTTKSSKAASNKSAVKKETKRTKKAEKVIDTNSSVKVYFLGGLNEIGKNLTVFECNGDMIVVDCGMTFPSVDMLGVDLVLPDFTFIKENASRIKGVFLTHGHEDHIGGIPYLFKEVRLPVYATSLTLGIVKLKMKEHNLVKEEKLLHEVSAGSTVKAGCFKVEFIHVNHSISDAVAFAIHTPAGTVVHTGDFKIDCTPENGEMIDLGRFASLGKEGVLALLADSTNADNPGFTPTEQTVKASFENIFERSKDKRIIIATFASNISRVQQIINCAEKYGRKVIFSGRSMLNVMGIAAELGKLRIPDGILVDIDMINRYQKEDIVLVTTGSQGEPMSALTRIAFSDHRKVTVGKDDTIVISARPIPGNEKTIGTVIDELLKQGCEVLYESMYEVHVSGHARQEELKMIQALTKPKFFIPVHGEQKHLRKHAELSKMLGMSDKKIFIGDIGSAIELNAANEYIKVLPSVEAGKVLVDGLGVGDVGSVVLKDRKHLGEDGLIVIVFTVDSYSGQLMSGPDVVSRGFVYVKESESIMDDIKGISRRTIERGLKAGFDYAALKLNVKDNVSRMLYEQTRRSPMILPILMEV